MRVMRPPLERELEELEPLRAAAQRGESAAHNVGRAAAVFGLLALGDVPLALGAILGRPPALGRTHRQLPTNRGAA